MSDVAETDLRRLLDAARAASREAYAPYSRFAVGAAVLTASGAVVPGCNVENASFGLTVCAERVALLSAAARGHRRVVALAVYTPTATPTAPCGACRQVLHEFGPGALVVSACDGPATLRARLNDWLPEAFGPADLA